MGGSKNQEYFHCKQFSIRHDIASLKVTTEALILGAYTANFSKTSQKILDIGTGTGLFPLMIAQKSDAKIEAVEIDFHSFLLANENVKNSKFSDKIIIHHTDIQSFKAENQFDLIVSNPPFFNEHLKSNSKDRNLAIHNDSLPFSYLAKAVFENLEKSGKFIVLLPPHQLQLLETELLAFNLIKVKEFEIHHKLNSKVLRIIATFEYNFKVLESEEFYIKDKSENYTIQFKELLIDYYLIF
jgi:tRNA1Val (adenine37-N6)-methyltransferase